VRIVLTAAALLDLDDIRSYTATHFPTALPALDRRLQAILRRIGAWPESAPAVTNRPGVRMVPLVRDPFRIFYRIAADRAELPHTHHAARLAP
jgi:plasmid stabilization system protein ParE